MTPKEVSTEGEGSAASPGRTRLIVFLVLVGVVAVAVFVFRDELSLESLAAREEQLQALLEERPLLVYGAAFLIYVAVTALSLPGAAAMSLAVGWFFGFVRGVVFVSFASTTGATLAFLLSRYLLRDAVQRRFGRQLARVNETLRREGAFYLFSLRLIPAVPFFVINVVMGLAPIKVRTFWWVSQLGMLPGTCVYVFAGSTIPSLDQLADRSRPILSPQLVIAFVLLGLFPLVVKKIWGRFGRRPTKSEDSVQQE